ncbi:MAG: carboxymuconolactone decarboxylase family protein [Desulfobacterales bacterium]
MRLASLVPEMMDDEQRDLYNSINTGERAKVSLTDDRGALVGPYNTWLYSPYVGERIQQLGAALRFHNALPPNLLELAILMIGCRWSAQFEWWAHARLAKRAGLSDETIDHIKSRERPESATPDELIVHDFCLELLDGKRVSDDRYQETKALIGEKGIVDLISLMGYYTMISMTLNVFEIPLPEGEALPFDES